MMQTGVGRVHRHLITDEEYPTVHHCYIPMHLQYAFFYTQLMIAYKTLTEYFWELQSDIALLLT